MDRENQSFEKSIRFDIIFPTFIRVLENLQGQQITESIVYFHPTKKDLAPIVGTKADSPYIEFRDAKRLIGRR
jgi:molecular chaperone DnaK (HSP70)